MFVFAFLSSRAIVLKMEVIKYTEGIQDKHACMK